MRLCSVGVLSLAAVHSHAQGRWVANYWLRRDGGDRGVESSEGSSCCCVAWQRQPPARGLFVVDSPAMFLHVVLLTYFSVSFCRRCRHRVRATFRLITEQGSVPLGKAGRNYALWSERATSPFASSVKRCGTHSGRRSFWRCGGRCAYPRILPSHVGAPHLQLKLSCIEYSVVL